MWRSGSCRRWFQHSDDILVWSFSSLHASLSVFMLSFMICRSDSLVSSCCFKSLSNVAFTSHCALSIFICFLFLFAAGRILEPARLVVAVLLSRVVALAEAVVFVLLSGAVALTEVPGSVVLTHCPSSPLSTLWSRSVPEVTTITLGDFSHQGSPEIVTGRAL